MRAHSQGGYSRVTEMSYLCITQIFYHLSSAKLAFKIVPAASELCLLFSVLPCARGHATVMMIARQARLGAVQRYAFALR
ncbi:MAG: hypothetical protein EAZ21_06245 [Betaproteobacteria bacterium]|nr:MAG: hypothetical protein EAZ21_06245 [Betaproteobacteria bacterium]